VHNPIRLKWVAALVVASVALTGCGGSRQPHPSQVAEAGARPVLKVPEAFANETERRMFVVQAVSEGHYAEAKTILEKVTALDSDSAGLALLGTARYNLSDDPGAIAAWSRAGELNPSQAGEMQNNIGNALRDSRKQAEAEASYRKALKLEPTRWTAAVNLATMLKLENKLPAAIAVLEAAIPANKSIEPLSALLEAYRAEARTHPK